LTWIMLDPRSLKNPGENAQRSHEKHSQDASLEGKDSRTLQNLHEEAGRGGKAEKKGSRQRRQGAKKGSKARLMSLLFWGKTGEGSLISGKGFCAKKGMLQNQGPYINNLPILRSQKRTWRTERKTHQRLNPAAFIRTR